MIQLIPINSQQMAVLSTIDNDPNLEPSTRQQYKRAIARYCEAGHDLLDASQLVAYARTVSKSERSFLRAALRKQTAAATLQLQGIATEDNLAAVQARILNLTAIANAIPLESDSGTARRLWLTSKQVKEMLGKTAVAGNVGRRDRVLLGLMVGAGLRVTEAVTVACDDIYTSGDSRNFIDVMGKGAKARQVPISDRLAQLIDEWCERIDGGLLARSITKGGTIGKKMSTTAVRKLVKRYGRFIGVPDLSPHDLRRSYARIGYDAGIDVGQISLLLGHADIKTTQLYLGLDINEETTVSDFVPL